jgi:hypothetical protein
LLLAGLTAGEVLDDPFWSAMAASVTEMWTGTASELLKLCDPTGNLAREHGREWPSSAKSLTHRLERTAPSLRSLGWAVERIDADPKWKLSVRWRFAPPPSAEASRIKDSQESGGG